jgi:epoxyqueuosine reductase
MGFHGDMHYLRQQKRRRESIEKILPGARSVVICAMRIPAGGAEPPADLGARAYGKVARYALHQDYHARLLPLLDRLGKEIDEKAGTTRAHAYVDTGPVSERAFAAQAGIGWIGKHSLLINRDEGSWLWLGNVITRAELEPDPSATDHCGKCRRCVEACPTGAIVEHLRTVDARKCLPHWNIEQRKAIPPELHAPMGDWLLGCDICQEVCPWNERSARLGHDAPKVEYLAVDELLAATDEELAERFRGHAAERVEPPGLRRNARIVKRNFEER